MTTPPPIAKGSTVNPAVAELATLDRWVCWKWEKRGDEWTKPPYRVGGRRKADSTNPKSWSSFEHCWGSAFVDGDADGIGFVLDGSDELMGADLDNCIDQDGTGAPWAQRLVRLLGSYAELP